MPSTLIDLAAFIATTVTQCSDHDDDSDTTNETLIIKMLRGLPTDEKKEVARLAVERYDASREDVATLMWPTK